MPRTASKAKAAPKARRSNKKLVRKAPKARSAKARGRKAKA